MGVRYASPRFSDRESIVYCNSLIENHRVIKSQKVQSDEAIDNSIGKCSVPHTEGRPRGIITEWSGGRALDSAVSVIIKAKVSYFSQRHTINVRLWPFMLRGGTVLAVLSSTPFLPDS